MTIVFFKEPFLRKKSFQIFFLVFLLLSVSGPIYAQQINLPTNSILSIGEPQTNSGNPGIQILSFLDRTEIQKKIINTFFLSIIAYVLLFTLINIINKRISDLKVRHNIRKNTIQYNLLHELGHLIALGSAIHPPNDRPFRAQGM